MSGLTNVCWDTFPLIAYLLPAALGGRYELFSFFKGATWRLQNDDPRLQNDDPATAEGSRGQLEVKDTKGNVRLVSFAGSHRVLAREDPDPTPSWAWWERWSLKYIIMTSVTRNGRIRARTKAMFFLNSGIAAEDFKETQRRIRNI